MNFENDDDIRAWCARLDDKEADRISWILMIPVSIAFLPFVVLFVMNLL